MNTLLARIQEQTTRVDRTRSLIIGLSAAVTALWAAYRVFWMLYSASVLSSVGLSSASMALSMVIWTVIGLAAGAVAAAFLFRYAKHT